MRGSAGAPDGATVDGDRTADHEEATVPTTPSPTTQSPTTQSPTTPATGRGVLPVLTWAVLVVSVVANSVASAAGAPLTVHLVLGGVTAAAVAALTVLHLRTRR